MPTSPLKEFEYEIGALMPENKRHLYKQQSKDKDEHTRTQYTRTLHTRTQ